MKKQINLIFYVKCVGQNAEAKTINKQSKLKKKIRQNGNSVFKMNHNNEENIKMYLRLI